MSTAAKSYETVDAIRADFPTGATVTFWEEPHVVTGHRLTRTYKMPQIQVYAVSDPDKRRRWMWVPNVEGASA